MKKTVRITAAALICLLCAALLQPILPAARAADAFPAQRVEAEDIRPGDEIVIVGDKAGSAVSVRPYYSRLSGAAVEVSRTGDTEILTPVDSDTAVFEVISAGGEGVYLYCRKGYLTSAETGNGLFYAAEPQSCSVWQFRDGSFLYNTGAVSTYNGRTYRNYYLEWYNGSYTTYGKSASSDPAVFTLRFYRLGTGDPEDPTATDPLYRLPVFETSDTHGYLADISKDPYGYLLAYISDKVTDVRGRGADARSDLAVLLDGGDIYQGHTLSNLVSGQSLAAAYQLMGYDAVTIGNHEFDWGIEKTVDADGTMADSALEGFTIVNTVPVVSANLYLNGEKAPFAADYVILDKTARNGAGEELPVRVAVIGFAGDYGSSIMYDRFTGAGFTIEYDYDIVNALADELEAGGLCDATILLTHHDAAEAALGIGGDSVIDLVLGGHTHINTIGVTDWGLRYLEPASYGAAYVYAELGFSAENGEAAFQKVDKAAVVPVTDDPARLTNIPANAGDLDPAVAALTDSVIGAVSDILTENIGYITESAMRYVYLPDSGQRATTAGNWVASIIARIAGADIGFVNNGGLRADFRIEEGQDRRYITRADMYTMFPFNNKIFCYELTWEDFLTTLEYAMTENGQTLFSQISGADIYYTDDTVNAIVTAQGLAIYADGEWRDGWKDKTVRVGVSEFLATTDRVSWGMSNPFVAWGATSRLLHSDRVDNEGAYEVLCAEAAANGGLLEIDTAPHFIERKYEGTVRDKAPALLSAAELGDDRKPAARTGLVSDGQLQALVVPPAGAAPDTYTLYYSIDGGGTWSPEVPRARAPGLYTVQARYVSGLYQDIVLEDIPVRIAQPSYVPPRPVPASGIGTAAQPASGDTPLPSGTASAVIGGADLIRRPGGFGIDLGSREETDTVVIPAALVKSLADSGSGLSAALPKGELRLNAAALDRAAGSGQDLVLSVKPAGDGIAFDARTGGSPLAAELIAVLPGAAEGDIPVRLRDGGSVIRKSAVVSGRAYALVPAGTVIGLQRREVRFSDVGADAWYRADVEFAAGRGLFAGVGGTAFAPDLPMTRAMLTAVLFRLEEAESGSGNPFPDVPEDAWYAGAARWAHEAGIVRGTGRGFEPDGKITREQLAVMLCRYAALLGLDTSGRASLEGFRDAAEVSDWAEDAMRWAVGVGLLRGDGGRLNPKAEATRAEAAALLRRLTELAVCG